MEKSTQKVSKLVMLNASVQEENALNMIYLFILYTSRSSESLSYSTYINDLADPFTSPRVACVTGVTSPR